MVLAPGLAKTVAAALVAAAALFCGAAAFAQGEPAIDAEGPVLKMPLSGFAVQVPVPAWTEGSGKPVLEQVDVKLSVPQPGITFLTFHRADENAILWTELMGVLAVARPGYTAGQAYRTMAEPMGQRCRRDALELFWIVPLPGSDREALAGLCGEYALDTRQAQPCDAGIFVLVAVEEDEGVVSAYHEWCTASFTAGDETRWPVSREEIEKRARQLQVFTDFTPIDAQTGE